MLVTSVWQGRLGQSLKKKGLHGVWGKALHKRLVLRRQLHVH